MIKYNDNTINKWYHDGELIKVYHNGAVCYYKVTNGTPPTPHDYSKDYLTFRATESGTFKFSGNSISYSIDDGTTWTSLASDTNTPTVNAGDKILWKATGLTPSSSSGIGRFSSTSNFTVEGNIMSLLFGDSFEEQIDLTGKGYSFKLLFSGCTGMTSAENMVLPATTLSQYCYREMFRVCTSLTTAPELPATTLEQYCYNQMFWGCTSLTKAPQLPATTLVRNCYYQMFYNCESLNSITCLATNISASRCTNGWVHYVAANGTFTKAASMSSWTTGDTGIPNGWTIQDKV